LAGSQDGKVEYETPTYHAANFSADAPTVPGYEILSELGRGGMGVVYKARQLSLNRIVALKAPRAGPTATAVAPDRFRAEAEVVAQLHHPHIVQVHDFGIADGRPFFSMEFLDGGTLADRIKDTVLPARPAAAHVTTLARAVHAAHSSGIIHRDLKPANVLLANDGTPKVGDFGLALLMTGETEASGVVGTPDYMAPEQAEGRTEQIGPTTDVYALGAILYRLLTGRPPHEGTTVLEALEQVVSRPPVPPRRLQPTVPRDLEAICLKCLEKRPEKRYATAAALADDIDRFLAGSAVRARRTPAWETLARVVRRRPALVSLGLILFTLAVGIAWYWHSHLRVTMDYYANVATRWGAPEGVGPLSAEQVRHRGQSYRLWKRAGRVERMEVVNALGRPADRPVRSGPIATADDLALASRSVCAFDYHRDESGRLTDEIARNVAGDVIWSFHYTSADTGVYKDRAGLPFPPVPSGAVYVRFNRTQDGLDREQFFLDAAGRAEPDARGFYGERHEFDARGMTSQLANLGSDGKPASSRFSPAVANFRRDDLGNVTSMSYHDPAGRAAITPQDFSRAECGYDEWGNLTRMTYFGIDGRRCLRTDSYSEFVFETNDRGEPVVARCFDTGGHPIICQGGYAQMRLKYDDYSHPIEISFYDKDNRPCDYVDRFSILRSQFDARGFRVRVEYFDREDRPCKPKIGYSRLDRTVSADGRTIESRIFGPDGQPARDAAGVECWTVQNDEHDRETERRFWTASGKPCLNTEGYSGWRNRYDERGNVIECTFFGTDGRPCLSANGVARWTARYDGIGKEPVRTHFDLADRQLREIVVVTKIDPDSVADKLGIHLGDVLLTYSGRPLSKTSEFAALRQAETSNGPSHQLIVGRNGAEVRFMLPPARLGLWSSNRWIPK
jgi:tRNA A-37 threonylcarbamoyl transferase component Bud32